MVHKVTPSGAYHEVGVDQLFFSTTDDKGVIDQVNSVFVGLSRYGRDQLMGAPHNIIRHPAMPGGAFKAMWDTLESGKPFGAYVRNLAADGSEYVVFATVTPLEGGGYLSVRSRPVCKELFSAALKIYRDVVKVEEAQLSSGLNRREAAVAGAERIGELLAEAGFPAYTDFQYLALPSEVARREELSGGFPERPAATGLLGDTLAAVQGIYSDLEIWVNEQGSLGELSKALRTVGNRIEQEMTDATVTPETLAIFEGLGPAHRKLGEPLQLWLQMQGIVRNTLSKLLEALRKLDVNSHQTRFRVALARLHTTMMANFTAELIDGGPEAEASANAIEMLTRALRQGLVKMREQSEEHRRLTAETAQYIEQTAYATEVPREVLLLWSRTIAGPDVPEEVRALAPKIMSGINRAGESLAELKGLALRCQELSGRTRVSNIDALIDQVAANAQRIADPAYRAEHFATVAQVSPPPPPPFAAALKEPSPEPVEAPPVIAAAPPVISPPPSPQLPPDMPPVIAPPPERRGLFRRRGK